MNAGLSLEDLRNRHFIVWKKIFIDMYSEISKLTLQVWNKILINVVAEVFQ